jgi:DNA-binding IscR family transcriptional regulator
MGVLFHVVEAIDGVAFTNSCILGFSECSWNHPCAAHERWASLRERIYDMLVERSIAQVARNMKKPPYKVHGK